MGPFDKLRQILVPNQQERIAEGLDIVKRRDIEQDELEKQGIDPYSFKGLVKGMMINPPQLSDIRNNLGLNREAGGLEAQQNLNRIFNKNIDLDKTTFGEDGYISGMTELSPEQQLQKQMKLKALHKMAGR